MVRLGHAPSPRAAAPSPEQEAHFDEYKKKRGMSRFGSWAPGKLFDSALQKAVGKALNAVEAMVVIEDPYMPKCFGLRDLATATKKQLWVEVKDALNDMINESISSADADYRHMRLRNWAAYPHLWPANRCLPNPYNWFRAHFLYAIFPADASRWKMLRDPFAVVIILLSLCPLYAVSVWMFILLFFLIDKRDEHQLVGYILKFKATQFLTVGLYNIFKFAVIMYDCLDGVYDHEADDRCIHSSPGHDPNFMYLCGMEPIRIGFVYIAFLMLVCGYAFGGKEEVLALEHVRIDAADGSLDGHTHTKKLKKNVHLRADQGVDDDEYLEATASARALYGAVPRMGGVLKYFMLYDLVCLVTVVGFFMFLSHHQGYRDCEGEEAEAEAEAAAAGTVLRIAGCNSFMFKVTLYYMKVVYALLSAPFLLFMIPIVGPALSEARITGYDRAGHVCPKLTKMQLRNKYNFEMKHHVGTFKTASAEKLAEMH